MGRITAGKNPGSQSEFLFPLGAFVTLGFKASGDGGLVVQGFLKAKCHDNDF